MRANHRIALASLALLLAAAAVPAAATTPTPPPAAAVRPVTETFFGTAVTDPYRWMENLSDPAVAAYLRDQNAYARAVLGQFAAPRAKLLARIKRLDDAGIGVYDAVRLPSGYFYLKLPRGAETGRLYVRALHGGGERLLLDPERLGNGATHYAIDYFTPSLDGRHVAVGISAGGSENDTLYVVDAATGKRLGDAITRMTFDGVSWRPDGRSFYYTRMQALGPHDPPTAARQKIRAYLHVLGRPAERDPLIFGYGASPAVPFTPDEDAYVMVSPASPYAIGYIVNGVQPNVRVYATKASTATSRHARWTLVASAADYVRNIDFRGSTIYVQRYGKAPRGEVVATSLAAPDLHHPRVLIPASARVVVGIGAAADGLYVQDLDAGLGRLRKVDAAGHVTDVRLPYDGAISELSTDVRLPGYILKLGAWTRPSLIFGSDGATVADTRLKPLIDVDFSGYASAEVQAPSKDGTMVPLSIIYRKGIALDGSHPARLEGYGAYGTTIDPYFDPTRLAWLERGGIFAYAHVRGGGEFGEDWHRAGMKLTKQNAIDDMIACARYLIERKYTSTPKLGIWGGSAGGIVIGGVIDQRPDLIAAAIDDVGSNNALRQEFSPNGPGNVPEFGSVATQEGFKALEAMDAVAHVKDGTAYPAVLLETGINDPRVAPWESAKYAARLQAASSSGKPILLRVDYAAGHGYGSTKAQEEEALADEWTFYLWQFGDPQFAEQGISQPAR